MFDLQTLIPCSLLSEIPSVQKIIIPLFLKNTLCIALKIPATQIWHLPVSPDGKAEKLQHLLFLTSFT